MAKELWWSLDGEQVAFRLETDIEKGLRLEQVKDRQTRYLNQLEQKAGPHPLTIFLNQFTDTMVLVLLAATVVSGLIGAMADAITIMIIVFINAVLGFVQEYRAERSLDEIKKLASPEAVVIRNQKQEKILARDLVPGDLVLLESGDKVPADIRLIETSSLELDESALSGESIPVLKSGEVVCKENTPLADRKNMAFMGTSVTRGRGVGIVVEVGMQTIMGEIAQMIDSAQQDLTPLQYRLNHLGKILIIICLVVCLLVTVLGLLRGEDFMVMMMAGISLAVAAIPEGLPAIVTIVLALGVQRMAKKNAIVRKLPAVETLGCTTVICSDKTGTLTCNQMTVKKVATLSQNADITGEGYTTKARFLDADTQKAFNSLQNKDMQMLMCIAANCNHAKIKTTGNQIEVQGDPTEAALLIMTTAAGYQEHYPIQHEIPFDSERKRMSVIVKRNGQYWLLVKGALESLLPICKSVYQQGKEHALSPQKRSFFEQMQENWAADALRVLGFAVKRLPSSIQQLKIEESLEKDLSLVGICGMIDPPRPEVRRSVRRCQRAGIIPIMITGDHPLTAAAIAQEIGISKNRAVIHGSEIDKLSDDELYKRALDERVFARVSPQHKNRIITILKQHQHVVAMTGDGVNDAPAVKSADIGVAMGINGTQVTKEAASMILADDNFTTIVDAVYEGRAIYDNIRKFIRYLLGCNIGEILVMLLACVFAIPLPLLPIQILWINLVTDGLPAMALGVEPPEPGIMTRPPRPSHEGIFARGLGRKVFTRGVYIAVVSLLAFGVGWYLCRNDLTLARTMTFTTLVFAQLFYVFECRSETYTPFELGFFKNRFLIVAVCCSVIMHLGVLYLPFLQQIFHTTYLLPWHWMLILLLSGSRMIVRFLLFTGKNLFGTRYSYVKINP